MGSGMAKIVSLVTRPFKNYNIESRAHRIISRDKPTQAPKYKADQVDYERIMKEYPEVYQESLTKNEQLNKYLKDVYVTSHDPFCPKIETNPNRPLPVDRHTVQDFEYGMQEPENIPKGKTTLRQILQFLTDHHTDAAKNSIENIAKDYSIPEKTVENIVTHFKIYEVYIPTERKVKAKFAGPTVPRIKVVQTVKKQLPSGQNDEGKT